MPTFEIEEFNHIANQQTMSARTDDLYDAITRFRSLVETHEGKVPSRITIANRLADSGHYTVVNSGYGLSITQH